MNVELKHTEPFPDVYHIQDGCGNFATLVVGQCRALLYDTLLGVGNLRNYVEKITQFPLIVINSHCHPDHSGGNEEFSKIYCSSQDMDLLDTEFYKAYIEASGQKVLKTEKEKLISVKEGDCFDLGGLHANIIELPGHTKGSIGVFVPEKKLLLAGDAISPQMCLFLEGTAGLKAYRKTLQKLMKIKFDYFLLGHFENPYKKEMMNVFEQCSRLPGHKKGLQYKYSKLPEYKGMLYIYEIRNVQINELICIITEEGDIYEEI